MSFVNRSEFITAQASEKIVLAHVHATTRLITWSVDVGSIYKRSVTNFVYELKQGQVDLTRVTTYASIVVGSFYYNPLTNELFVHTIGSVNPLSVEMIVTYRFFYATAPVSASWDLTNTGDVVYYAARIKSSPGFKHKVGIEQGLVSLTGSGNLVLQNADGELDGIIDSVFFENQDAFVYNWNRDLQFNESQIIYRGVITNKSFDTDTISFTIRDQIFELNQQLPQQSFMGISGVSDNDQKNLQRIVYGRVDGIKLQSITQINEGVQVTGTVSSTGDQVITGVGTVFLSELSPGDDLIIDGVSFGIESVDSNTSMTLDNDTELPFVDTVVQFKPKIPVTSKNRTFVVSGHAGSKLVKTLVNLVQTNRVELNNTVNIFENDYLEFSTGERIRVKSISPGNVVVLQQSLVTVPTVSSDVIRQPVQSLYIEGNQVEPSDFTIVNLGSPSNRLSVTIASDLEFKEASSKRIDIDLTFTNGSRNVTTVDIVDLKQILKPRDWIKPNNILYTTYFEVLSVGEQSLSLRTVFTDTTITDDARAKMPNYIGDSTIVSADVVGKTKTGEPLGDWIMTASEVVQNIIESLGITNINQTTFNNVNDTVKHLVSIAFPLSSRGRLTKAKDAIDLINKSVLCSLTLDKDLDLQYREMYNQTPDQPRVITDFDVIKWDIDTSSGKTFRNAIVNYRFKDVNNVTLTETNSIKEHTSEFVRDYIGTDQTDELDIYLYAERSADIFSHRFVYFNRLGRSDISIESDLRLEGIAIGDTVQLEFDRLYKRLGGVSVRKKLVIVTGLTKTGTRIILECSDLGNTFNTSAIISPNTTNAYVDASVNEKLKYGFITDSNGIVEDIEETSNTNLIS